MRSGSPLARAPVRPTAWRALRRTGPPGAARRAIRRPIRSAAWRAADAGTWPEVQAEVEAAAANPADHADADDVELQIRPGPDPDPPRAKLPGAHKA